MPPASTTGSLHRHGPRSHLLDELPSYLQMASGRTVGEFTLADVTIGALERLFNALPKLPHACVVVTNLKDDIYLARVRKAAHPD